MNTVSEMQKVFQQDLSKRKKELQKELDDVTTKLNDIDNEKNEFFKEKVHIKDKDFGPLVKKFNEISKEVQKVIDVEIQGIKFEVYFDISLKAKLSLGWNVGHTLSKDNPEILLKFFDVPFDKRQGLRDFLLPNIRTATKEHVDALNEKLKNWKEEYKAIIKQLGLASYMEDELMDQIVIAASHNEL